MSPISLIILIVLALLITSWVRSLPKKKRKPVLIKIALVLLLIITATMALTGKLHWIAAVFTAILPFARHIFPLLLRVLPFLSVWQKKRAQQTNSGNQSSDNSKIIHLKIDHDAGVMYGSVLQGPFKNRELGTLDKDEFLSLLKYCRQQDQDSAKLLETYLDKRFGPVWRSDDSSNGKPSANAKEIQEAYEILGLQPNCSREDIIDAHRKLMQKNHPDRGGSDYIAAKINQAKDTLLND